MKLFDRIEQSKQEGNCNHVCTSDCRRVGCNCQCGEWHSDKSEVIWVNQPETPGQKWFREEAERKRDELLKRKEQDERP